VAIPSPRPRPEAAGRLPGRVDAVLLDVGGVLLLPDPAAIVAAGARAGIAVDPGRLEAAHYAAMAAWDRSTEAELWGRYVAVYFEAAGVPEALLDAVRPALADTLSSGATWSHPIPPAAAALRALARIGIPIGIVSNADGQVERILRELGLCQVGAGPGDEVGIVVDSTVVGYEKPDPRIFEIALRALGVEPQQAIHVGDSARADVAGAVAAGVTPIHLDPYGLCDDNGHAHVAALAEVVPLVVAARS
jgi:putative hydrolase of the HAD superfamily